VHGASELLHGLERALFDGGLGDAKHLMEAPTVLKLVGTKKDRWIEAGRQYNKAVDTATKQLLAQAKTILSPEEYASVEKWFDKSLNMLLNQQLIGTQASHK
jgi:hypothetical protein